jgi:hypothetical protein
MCEEIVKFARLKIVRLNSDKIKYWQAFSSWDSIIFLSILTQQIVMVGWCSWSLPATRMVRNRSPLLAGSGIEGVSFGFCLVRIAHNLTFLLTKFNYIILGAYC